jgi:predicted permease
VFFAPLPYKNVDDLYLLDGLIFKGLARSEVTNPQLMEYIRKNNTYFSEFATYHKDTSYKLYDQKKHPEIEVLLTTHNLFNVLGVKAHLGRLFNKAEKIGKKQPSIVLGYRTWKTIYQGDLAIIGEKIQLNQRRFKVIGVAPDNLVLPYVDNINEAVWIPIDMGEEFDLKKPNGFNSLYKSIIKLKSGLIFKDIQKALNTLISNAAKSIVPKVIKIYSIKTRLVSFKKALQGNSGEMVLFLLVGVVLLMMIALINLSSMQLARAMTRIKTIAIRFAFGATHKQLFIESFKHNFLVIGFSVWMALLFTYFSFSVIIELAKNDIQRLDTLGLSLNIFLLAGLLAIVIAFLYSFIELKVVNEKTLNMSLQSSGKGVGQQMSSGTSHLLIGLQIMFSFIILMVSCHIVWMTLNEALRSTGINTKNQWSLRIDYSNIKKFSERKNTHKHLMYQLKKSSFIQNVEETSISIVPYQLMQNPIYDQNNKYIASTTHIKISPNYLEQLGLNIKGKTFQLGDSELKNYPVIINQRLADIIGDSLENILGKKIRPWWDKVNDHRIIGIVPNTDYPGAKHFEINKYYTPQEFSREHYYYFLLTVINNHNISKLVQTLVNQLDKRLSISHLKTLDEQFNEKRQRHLIAAFLAFVLALFSLLIVMIGVNGIVNYMVQVRRYTLGVKLAMRAKKNRLLKESLFELMQPISMSLFFAFSICFLGLGYSLNQPELNIQVNWSIVNSIIIGFFVMTFLVSYFPIQKTLNSDPIKALHNE